MGSDDVDAPFEHCAYCGEPFDPGVSYPASSHRGDDGELRLHSFCDDICEAAWEAEATPKVTNSH